VWLLSTVSSLAMVLVWAGSSRPNDHTTHMFMRRNRAKNGAKQPEQIAASEAPAQRAQDTLIPNPTDLGTPQTRIFEPEMMTPEAIDRRHKMGGLDEAEWGDYSSKVPHGPMLP
jgi:hypothetical protein